MELLKQLDFRQTDGLTELVLKMLVFTLTEETSIILSMYKLVLTEEENNLS